MILWLRTQEWWAQKQEPIFVQEHTRVRAWEYVRLWASLRLCVNECVCCVHECTWVYSHAQVNVWLCSRAGEYVSVPMRVGMSVCENAWARLCACVAWEWMCEHVQACRHVVWEWMCVQMQMDMCVRVQLWVSEFVSVWVYVSLLMRTGMSEHVRA